MASSYRQRVTRADGRTIDSAAGEATKTLAAAMRARLIRLDDPNKEALISVLDS